MGTGKARILRLGLKIEQNTLLILIDTKNGNVDFSMEPYNKVIDIHKSKFKVSNLINLLIK